MEISAEAYDSVRTDGWLPPAFVGRGFESLKRGAALEPRLGMPVLRTTCVTVPTDSLVAFPHHRCGFHHVAALRG